MTEQPRLNHLLDRMLRGVLLPAEAEQLAALVRELEKSAAINAEVDAKADEQLNAATEVVQYYKALAERTQAWGEQHRDRANRYRARTDAVRAELTAFNSETRGLNPFAMAGRRDAVARIRAALQTVSHDTPVPDDPHVTELEQQLADATGELAEARDHNDRTCEAVVRAEKAEAAIERVRLWIGSEPVTARSEFGSGYREALRDIKDVLDQPQQPTMVEQILGHADDGEWHDVTADADAEHPTTTDAIPILRADLFALLNRSGDFTGCPSTTTDEIMQLIAASANRSTTEAS